MMKKAPRKLTVLVAVGVAIAVAVAYAAAVSHTAVVQHQTVGSVTKARAVRPSLEMRKSGTLSMSLIGVTNGRAFYETTKVDGSTCLGSGSAQAIGMAGVLMCSHSPLLTPDRPVIAFLEVGADRSAPDAWTVERVDGLADSNVASVKLTDGSGAVVANSTVSQAGVFSLQLSSPVAPGTLTAADSQGATVYSHSYR
jgi:hypothetical protein